MNDRNDEDKIIRDMILISCTHVDTSNFDVPTTISLYDTIEVLSKRSPDWIKDKFCQMIFAWAASSFMDSHVDEVCKDKCHELLSLCVEYRENKTMMGLPISPFFSINAIEYCFPQTPVDYEIGTFESAPVRNAYFEITEGI